MKKIIINSVEIYDFKGIIYKKKDFKDGRNIIKAPNGWGKTTIAEAIVFTMTGKGLFDEKINNEPITKNGKIKEDYIQKIILDLNINDDNFKIIKVIKRNKVTEMTINDKPYEKVSDFKAKIEEIIGLTESEITLLSNPKLFNNQTSKESRQYIINVVDKKKDISYINEMEVVNKDYLTIVVENLNKDIDLATQIDLKEKDIKLVKQDIRDIDTRISSNQENLKNITGNIEVKDISLIKKEKTQLAKQLSKAQEFNENINSQINERERLNKQLDANKQNIKSNNEKIDTLTIQKESKVKQLDKIKLEFEKVNAKEHLTKCNFCGSEITEDNVIAKGHKDKVLDELESNAKQFNKDVKELEKQISQLELDNKDIKSDNEIIIATLKKYAFIESKIDTVELQKKYNKVLATISSQDAINVINETIHKSEKARLEKKQELDKLEEELMIIKKAYRIKTQAIEDKINKKLKGVKVKLFNELKNGNIKDIFTIVKDGIDFSRMNNALQTNCGIELLNFIHKAIKVQPPIFIDNAESINKLQETTAQTIELYVSEREE